MIKNIERAKDGMDSLIDHTRDAVVGVADHAERGVESAAERAVDGARVAGAYVRDAADTVSRGARQHLETTAKAIDRGYRRTRDDGSRAATAATDYVAKNPGRALLLGASAGFVLGMLLRRRGVAAVLGVALSFAVAAAGAEERMVEPDDARLFEVVRLIESGVSGSVIAEHVRQSGRDYELSVNDLLYLQQNGARESTIAALLATGAEAPAVPAIVLAAAPAGVPAAVPADLIFEDLVLVKTGLLKGDRKGRLVLQGDVLGWEGRHNRKQDFTFQTAGLEKVWFTCEARSSESFCYQINFKIVKGDRYRFRDLHGDSGSNVAVTEVMEALRTHFPRLDFAAPTTGN